jgi:hypothetical protein
VSLELQVVSPDSCLSGSSTTISGSMGARLDASSTCCCCEHTALAFLARLGCRLQWGLLKAVGPRLLPLLLLLLSGLRCCCTALVVRCGLHVHKVHCQAEVRRQGLGWLVKLCA